jgi:hypothetical protein
MRRDGAYFVVFGWIDWALLARQKRWLLEHARASEEVAGLVERLDTIQVCGARSGWGCRGHRLPGERRLPLTSIGAARSNRPGPAQCNQLRTERLTSAVCLGHLPTWPVPAIPARPSGHAAAVPFFLAAGHPWLCCSRRPRRTPGREPWASQGGRPHFSHSVHSLTGGAAVPVTGLTPSEPTTALQLSVVCGVPSQVFPRLINLVRGGHRPSPSR